MAQRKIEFIEINNNWIPVSKMQPPLGKNVLVKYYNPHPATDSRISMDYRYYDYDNGEERWVAQGKIGWWMPFDVAEEILGEPI